jgi:hypothetical protein
MADPKATIRFVLDRTLGRQLRNDPEFQANLFDKAQTLASNATANGKKWNRSYSAEATRGPQGLPRVEANALPTPGNANFGGVGSWIEFGTQDAPPRFPLRNAVQASGMTLEEGGAR